MLGRFWDLKLVGSAVRTSGSVLPPQNGPRSGPYPLSVATGGWSMALAGGGDESMGGPCPSDMGESMTYAEKSEMRTGIARLWNHRLPHLQRRWATRPVPRPLAPFAL